MYGRLRPGLATFVIKVLLLGAVFFAAWYYVAQPISWSVARTAAKIAEAVGPVGRIRATIPDRSSVTMNVEPAGEYILRDRIPAGMSIDVPMNALKHTFGMPFFLALLFASRGRGRWWKAPVGLVVIGMLASMGMACELLLNLFPVATAKGVVVFPFSAAARETIAIGYQLGTLILPTVVPVVMWAVMDRGAALGLAGSESEPAAI